LGLTVPKTKKFTPIHSQNTNVELSDIQQLANLLITTDITEPPDSLVKLAISQSLGAFLLHRLTQTQTTLQDKELIQALKTDVRDSAIVHLLQERALLAVNKALTEANINCVWLNGVALSYTVYPTPQLRVKDSLDCLITPDDLPNTLKILKSLNFTEYEESPEAYTLSRLPIQLHHRQHTHLRVVLHQHVIGYGGRVTISDERLNTWRDNTISFDLQDQTFFILRPEHHFLYLCARGFLHNGQSAVELRDLLDLDLLFTTYDLDWDGLLAEVSDLQWTHLVAYVLNLVQDYMETPIPDHIFEALHKQSKTDEFMNYAVLKHDSNYDNDSALTYLWQLSFRDKLWAIIQLVFPPKRYIRQRYSIRSKRVTAPFYVHHIVTHLAQIPIIIIRRIVALFR